MDTLLRIDLIKDNSLGDFPKPAIIFAIDWVVLLILGFVLLSVIILWIYRKKHIKSTVVPVKIVFGKGSSIEYKIVRNDYNAYIAHRIYIELVTRKAALQIDFENDVIKEIYDSWYSLFGIIRNEIKSVPGELLLSIKSTYELTNLTIEILNKGLRPHLTKFQAKFNKWYKVEIGKRKNNNLTPQEVQAKYPAINELKRDMTRVSTILVTYADQLKKLFDCK